MIVCDKDKLDEQRCNGAPDFIIEIVSPSNPSDDYIKKAYYYKNYGVREYWIVDPKRKTITVNYFEGNIVSVQYLFDSTIKVNIYNDLYINFSEIADLLIFSKKEKACAHAYALYHAYVIIYISINFLNLLPPYYVYPYVNKLLLLRFFHLFFKPLFEITFWIIPHICKLKIFINNLCIWIVHSKFM